MQFMLLINLCDYERPGDGNVEAMRAMGQFNEEMQKAGVLVDMNGLHPPATATRIAFKDGVRGAVTDGPFAEAKEVVGGYWIVQVKSQAEAVEWASRAPVHGDATIEIRRLYEFTDFPAEIQESDRFPELKGTAGTFVRRSMTGVSSAVDAVWRIESPRLIAGLTRMVRDLAIAEDLAQDALVAALEQWPASGVPRNPGSWLMTIAKRRAIDRFRREDVGQRKAEEFGRELPLTEVPPDFDPDRAGDIDDDLLRLVFIACHPVLAQPARVALTLRLIGGLSTVEIARAFFVPEATVAQRIVRAKRTLSAARVPFEVPHGADRMQRLGAVLEVLYLIFNEGYCATAGDDWLRPALCEDALRMGRVVAQLMPSEAEVHGLVALMEIQASRASARVGPNGEPVLLLDQQRSRWDHALVRRGLAALVRAEQIGTSFGPYALQASIAAVHARAKTAEETDWPQIVALYDALLELMPSPVVALNRAVAVGIAYGPAAGLEAVDELRGVTALEKYHFLPSVRGDLLLRLGRTAEARAEFARAARLTENAREREMLLARAKPTA